MLRVCNKHKANTGSKRENREVAEKQCSEIWPKIFTLKKFKFTNSKFACVCSFISFNKCKECLITTTINLQYTSITPWKFPPTACKQPSTNYYQPLIIFRPYFPNLYCCLPRISYKWYHTTCGLLSLALFHLA